DSASRKKLHDRCLAYHRASAIDFAPQANLILPGLFLCDMYSATDELVLNSIRPTHIMHVLARPTCSYGAPIHTKRIAIEDKSTVDILSHLDDAMEWLHEAIEGGGTVLVHCMWGKSRSAAFVMAYLMAKKGMSLEAAFGHVKERRSIIGPNEGFMRQLRVFEKKLRR
ncbi:phosphatases II, partial [Artomyces pyxidatus]